MHKKYSLHCVGFTLRVFANDHVEAGARLPIKRLIIAEIIQFVALNPHKIPLWTIQFSIP